MDKLVIDLNNKDLQEFKSVLTPFASGVRQMLMDLYSVGYDFPVSLRGTQIHEAWSRGLSYYGE